jgi:hypothetical protein
MTSSQVKLLGFVSEHESTDPNRPQTQYNGNLLIIYVCSELTLTCQAYILGGINERS